MVGVPRSKGCRICVQRRVKCDQTRPTCNNCKKGNRPCPGYAQDLKFQDEGVRLRKRYDHQGPSTTISGVDSNHDSDESPPGLSSTATADANTDVATNVVSPREDPNATTQDGKHWDVVGLDLNKTKRRTFLGLLEGKTQAYLDLADTMPEHTQFKYTINIDDPWSADFLFTNFSKAFDPHQHIHAPEQNQNALITKFKESLFPDNQSIPAAFKSHARWLSHLPPLTGTNPLLDAAVRAVTLVHIGRLNNSEPFVMESRPYYGQALRLLNKALQDKRSGTSSETLCAVILLSFYEMFASDNNDSWIRHAGGVSALMRARGPAKHRHGFDREIYLAYRYTLIIEAFQEDVPCFLAEPAWLQMSREVHSDLKTASVTPARLEIFDLAEEYYASMVTCPEICANARSIWQAKQNGTPPPCNRAELIEKTIIARTTFKGTFTRFEAALKRAGVSPTINLNQRDPLIGIEYEFVNTFISATYTGYWTVLIVLNLCLQGLQSEDAEIVQYYEQESRDCALNICRSTAFMLTSSFLGPFFIIFGLRVGLLVFEQTDHGQPAREADWILRKLFEIGDKHMGIAKHVPGYRPGITADDLIAEFRSRSKKSKQGNDVTEKQEFNRQVANGDIFDDSITPDVDVDVEGPFDTIGGMRKTRAAREGERAFAKLRGHSGLQKGSWQDFEQVEDVWKTWDEQNRVQLQQNMDNLNETPAATTAKSSSGTGSPQPPMGTQEHQPRQRFASPDIGFFDPTFGMNDEQLPDLGQTPNTFVQNSQQKFLFADFEGTEARPAADLALQDFGLGPARPVPDQPQRKNTFPRGLERFFTE
ncbi:hypothetical protein PMZ80_006231 [Knufia obscura]|uniref:Zn(2)-C6 fungal-type domain-containing protein n=1 Tax=Knufia obscura TaxID=1635080 RepID=A0ABR0RL55_9EURO|nr:hypothetical protein PMZ80_006231 [Knufia obscura]